MIQKPEQLLFSADQAMLHQRNRFFKTRSPCFALIQGLAPLQRPGVIQDPSEIPVRGIINPSGDLSDNWKVAHKDLLLDFPLFLPHGLQEQSSYFLMAPRTKQKFALQVPSSRKVTCSPKTKSFCFSLEGCVAHW